MLHSLSSLEYSVSFIRQLKPSQNPSLDLCLSQPQPLPVPPELKRGQKRLCLGQGREGTVLGWPLPSQTSSLLSFMDEAGQSKAERSWEGCVGASLTF